MIQNIRNFTTNFQKGLKVKVKLPQNYRKIKNIVVAGMGGSAISGQILKDSLALKFPLDVSRNHTLPSFVNQETLLICISYSGNTREALNQFNRGIKRKAKIIAITSGGKLKTKAKRFKIPLIEVPTGFLPRESLPYLLSASIKALKILNLTRESFNFRAPKIEKEAKALVKKIKRTFLIICSQYPSVSLRWENQLSENSKYLSESKALPELAHNEIESWIRLNKKHSLIFLRDERESKEMKALIKGIKKIVKNKAQVLEVYGRGKTRLGRILYLIIFGGFVSYFLAKENKVDPRQNKYITALKKEIKKAS